MRQDLYTTYWKDAIPTMKYRSVADVIDNLPKSWKGSKHVHIKYYDGNKFKRRVCLSNTSKVAYKPMFDSEDLDNKLVESNTINNGIHVVCINMDTKEILEKPDNDVLEALYYLACTSLHALGKHIEYTDIFCKTPLKLNSDGTAVVRDSNAELVYSLISELQQIEK